ncbi:type II toxin-antitoxin system prevent-host-death family antitoxin [Marinomonas primoryensis]|jgi:prevent-host-death family protein|uniref:type II toxin-antitoxin system prevent-host-death family antitoxin n=1 Tax=Marinomonas primoryensis TaxID=178399 RepID=UPI0037043A53
MFPSLKINFGKVVSRTQETHRPILLISRGRGVAVVQSLEEYEKATEELGFLRVIYQGLEEASDGNTV